MDSTTGRDVFAEPIYQCEVPWVGVWTADLSREEVPSGGIYDNGCNFGEAL